MISFSGRGHWGNQLPVGRCFLVKHPSRRPQKKFLQRVWPYVCERHRPAALPVLTGRDLMLTAAKRRNSAAPGLDGWRTTEVKALPLSVFNAIAAFFIEIESGIRAFPTNLGLVKQVLLDKGGPDLPLQKRIISLLSIFVVSYTGLRFRQLQEWQNTVMPKQLLGGIKGRNMSEVFSRIQLDIDFAKNQNEALIGLKLDKSKCFDRLVPSITSSLLVAFGVPGGLVTFFLQMYTGLKRFLAYKEWVATTPTTGFQWTDSRMFLVSSGYQRAYGGMGHLHGQDTPCPFECFHR